MEIPIAEVVAVGIHCRPMVTMGTLVAVVAVVVVAVVEVVEVVVAVAVVVAGMVGIVVAAVVEEVVADIARPLHFCSIRIGSIVDRKPNRPGNSVQCRNIG
jgi:hypothetical protein